MTQHVVPSQVLTCPTRDCDRIKLCSVTFSTRSVTLTIQFHKGQTLVERGYV